MILRKERFIKQLLLVLGEEWRIYAGQAITIQLDTQISYMAWQFCFDNLLFTWLDAEDVTQEVFLSYALKRIQPYSVDPIYFKPVCDGFYYSSQQLWIKMKLSRPSSMEQIKSVDQIKNEDVKTVTSFLKPLVVVSERIFSYFKKEQQLIQHPSEMEEELPEMQSFKQITKLNEQSLSLDLVQNAYEYVSQFFKKTYQNCQVAKSFIVNIIEVNQDVLSKFYQNPSDAVIKIRIMQPSTLIYDSLFSVWALVYATHMVTGANQQSNSFYDLVGRSKAMLGDNWNDNYQAPVELFFNTISTIHAQILIDPKIKSDEHVKHIINRLRHKLNEIWEMDIVQKAYQ